MLIDADMKEPTRGGGNIDLNSTRSNAKCNALQVILYLYWAQNEIKPEAHPARICQSRKIDALFLSVALKAAELV